MNLQTVLAAFTQWLTVVADAILAAVDRAHSSRRVRLIEEDACSFRIECAPAPSAARIRLNDGDNAEAPPPGLAAALRGSRVELVLQPGRFVFRSLELPRRATEFLDGIVRAQIDRLTPWTAADAAFGWTSPSETEKDRVCVTVGATARALIMPHVQALARLGAKVVVVTTMAPGIGPQAALSVFELRAQGSVDVGRMRRGLAVVLIAATLSGALVTVVAQFVAGDLDRRQGEVSRRISERRTAMRRDGSDVVPAQQIIERRKQQSAASVMVLEALSRTLPDNTFVTELRIDGDRLQVVGMTLDAPGLIRLMEQSPHFVRATFFAPTTRSPGDSGERFHIEVHLKPVFSPT